VLCADSSLTPAFRLAYNRWRTWKGTSNFPWRRDIMMVNQNGSETRQARTAGASGKQTPKPKEGLSRAGFRRSGLGGQPRRPQDAASEMGLSGEDPDPRIDPRVRSRAMASAIHYANAARL